MFFWRLGQVENITFFIISPRFELAEPLSVSDNFSMKDDIMLSIAFVALNAGVIAFFVSGYVKGGMNFGSVFDFIFK